MAPGLLDCCYRGCCSWKSRNRKFRDVCPCCELIGQCLDYSCVLEEAGNKSLETLVQQQGSDSAQNAYFATVLLAE